MTYNINLFFTSANRLTTGARLFLKLSLVLYFGFDSGFRLLRPLKFGRSENNRKHLQFTVKDT